MVCWFGQVSAVLLQFFVFFSVFCIGSSNSGADNTAKMPVFCSTNRDTGILLCIRHFSCRKAFSTGNIVQYNRLQPMPVFAGLRSLILPFYSRWVGVLPTHLFTRFVIVRWLRAIDRQSVPNSFAGIGPVYHSGSRQTPHPLDIVLRLHNFA